MTRPTGTEENGRPQRCGRARHGRSVPFVGGCAVDGHLPAAAGAVVGIETMPVPVILRGGVAGGWRAVTFDGDLEGVAVGGDDDGAVHIGAIQGGAMGF